MVLIIDATSNKRAEIESADNKKNNPIQKIMKLVSFSFTNFLR